MPEKLPNYIKGEWQTSQSEDWIEVKNPALDEPIALHPKSTEFEIDRAVASAKEAFHTWRHTPPAKRAATMFQFRMKLMENKVRIAETMVQEHGKTMADAMGELGRAIECVEYVCAAPELQKGIYSENVGSGVDAYCILEPLGPFAILPPFNFPALISCYFVWPVAMGNTVLLKPPDLCPMTVQRIVEVAHACDFPPGVVNMVCGSAEAGKRLVTHPDVVGVTFVGSSKVGEIVYRTASGLGKRVQVQAGAKNHVVIAADANIEGNLSGLISAAFGSTSQRCFAASNFLVHDSLYEKFTDRFVAEAKRIRIGSGMNDDVDIGPLVSKSSLDCALSAIEGALDAGAKMLLDGRYPKVEKYPKGYFLAPTILEAEESLPIWKEEVFAPVRCLKRFGQLSDAVSVINSSPYGHSAAIFTENGGLARDFVRKVNTGHVGINVGTPVPVSYMSVGGRKSSFFGDLRGQGTDAIAFCTDKKFVAQRWSESIA
jgi:malonate-semialdehyde dehydrogenase (acetylating)/methylmalonate-semialdehyde dehydrogenase